MPELETLNPGASSSSANATDAASDLESGVSTDSSTQVGSEDGDSTAAQVDESSDPPFHEHPRWKQLQAEKKALEAKIADLSTWEPVIAEFKAQGMTDAQAVKAAASERDYQTSERGVLAGIAQQLQSAVERGEIEESAAEERFQRIQIERQTQREQAQSGSRIRAYEVREQLPALQREYPLMDEEDVAERALANPSASLKELAAKSHEKATKIIARHTAKQAAKPTAAVEGVGGGSSSSGKSVDDMSAAEFDKWKEDQLRTARRAGR